MNVVNWNPISGLDDFFGRSFSGFLTRPESGEMPSMLGSDTIWRPVADISETEKEYFIKAQLPGVDKKDVDISFDRGILTISGERKVEKSSEDEQVRRAETFYGKYSRSFSLPDDIDEKKVNARSKDGVFTIRLPKLAVEKHTPKKITID